MEVFFGIAIPVFVWVCLGFGLWLGWRHDGKVGV